VNETARPAVVWARPDQAATAVASPVAPETTSTDAAPAAAAPLTRRAARARSVEPATSVESVTAVESAAPAVPAPTFQLPAPAAETPVTDTTPFELLEPIAPMTTTFVESADEPADTSSASASVDEFEAAARLFSFTGETPIQHPAAEPVADEAQEPEPVAHDVPRGKKPRGIRAPRRSGASFKRVAATSFSVSAMAIVGLLAVGMTTPAVAVASSSPAGDVALKTEALAGDVVVDPEDIQAYVAPAAVENVSLDREAGGYETASLRDLAAEEGVTTFSSFFTNDPTAAIQWPFAVGVPMSFGYGMRWGAMHTGIDLTPGNGAEIHAIADGVVRSASDATGGYGVNIYINHIIDGKLVTSHYAHMQYGSMRVKAGDHVKVGQVIGLVGNTGHSFGAHLHFEILLNGTQLIDPLPWMRKNAGRASLGD
jgi:hypothetical protein